MDILVCLALLLVGFSVGFSIKSLLVRRQNKGRYSGTIYVTQGEEKTLYSLELDDYPETLQFKKEVVFKVDSPKKSQDRE